MIMLDATTYRKLFSRVGFCFFALMALAPLAQGIVYAGCEALIPWVVDTSWFFWVASYVPLYGIAVPVFLWLLKLLLPQNSPAPVRNDLNILQTLQYLVLSFGGMYLFNLLTGLVIVLIEYLSGGSVVNPVMEIQQSSGLIWNLLFGCLIAPVGEEFIFRKVLYHKLGVLGDKCYILTGGLIFGLFHGNLSQFFYAFALGLLFCYIYARTGRILYTILLHVLVNMVGMVLAPMALKNQALLMLFGMAVLAFIAGAIAIVVLRHRSVTLTPPPVPLPEHPVRRALLAPGMVFYWLLCACMIVFVLLAPLFTGGAAA